MYLAIGLDKAAGYKLNASEKNKMYPGLSLGRLHMGRQVQRDKSFMGGLMGDIGLMGVPNFVRLCHKLKALLLLSCNYMMQFIGYDCIQTC